MASNPLFIIPDFFCIFPMNFARRKEMGKFLWKDREKGLPSWLSQFSFANRADLFPYLPKGIFPISFKPNVRLENAKKSGIMKSGLDTMPLFLLEDLLNIILQSRVRFSILGLANINLLVVRS